MNKLGVTILLACVLVLLALVLSSGLAAYSSGQHAALLARPPAHGTSILIEADLSQAQGDTNALAKLKEAINRRFDKFGSKIFWRSLPDARILILTPITAERELVVVTNLISRGGHLEFHLVHENSDQLVMNGGEIPADYELLAHPEKGTSGQAVTEQLVVKREPEAGLTGNIIRDAGVSSAAMGQPQIYFHLNPESTLAFAGLTRTNIHHRLAIIMDGQLYSAPTIATPIETGNGAIAGRFTRNEARTLAYLMEYPLPVPVTVVETKTF